jgi:outer membrane receptor protein involved in Fe transport
MKVVGSRKALSIKLLALAGVSCIGIYNTSAFAQEAQGAEASSDKLDVIIVTANKRAQNLSDVGVSVTSITSDSLVKLNITDSVGITQSVPNLVNATVFGAGSNTNFSLRGVSQNDYNDGTESPNATYIDDVYYIPTGAGSFPLYDMERVEVLRGPQGTLFGRNSTGGLLHFITKKPTFDTTAQVFGSYGRFNEYSLGGVINVPLSQQVALRVSARYGNGDGWIRNVNNLQPKAGGVETVALRGQLRIESGDITSNFKASFDKASGYSTGVARDTIGIDPITGDQFVAGNLDLYDTGPGNDKFGFDDAGSGPDAAAHGQDRRIKANKSITFQNNTDIKLSDQITLTSVTAYNKFTRDQTEDCDGTPDPICQTHYDNRNEQFTQELRAFGNMGTFRWTLGAYYLQQVGKQNAIVPLFYNAVALGVDTSMKVKGYAAFVNLEYDVSPQLTVIAGIRGSRDVKSIQQINGVYAAPEDNPDFDGYIENASIPLGAFLAGNIFTDATANGLNKIKKNGWSGKFEIDYKPNRDTLIYASVSRGLKSPGFNNGIISNGLSPNLIPFRSEKMVAFELGLKSTFADGRASANLAGFYYDYKDFQAVSFEGVGSLISNRDAKIYGMEAEFNAKPIDGLTLSLSGGYVHTKLYDVPNAGGVSADREMALAPSWTVNGRIRYEVPIGSNEVGFQLDANARDSFFNNPGNDTAATIPKFHEVNGRIDLTGDGKRFNLALVGKNLLNDRFITSVFVLQGLGGYRYIFWNKPRTVSVEATINF